MSFIRIKHVVGWDGWFVRSCTVYNSYNDDVQEYSKWSLLQSEYSSGTVNTSDDGDDEAVIDDSDH